MLPDTRNFMTYEGSLTEPGCQETVTWMIMNKPIYATPQQVKSCFFFFFENVIYKKTFKKIFFFHDYKLNDTLKIGKWLIFFFPLKL